MDWAGAIETNRDKLIEVVTRLFVLAGLRTGVTVATLPRHLRIRLLAMLRPAEYAARRLIVMAACTLVTVAMRPAERCGKPHTGSVIVGPETPRLVANTAPAVTLPAFSLFDPHKRYGHPWLEDGADDDAETWSFHTGLNPNAPVDATGLCRRIRALEHALQNLESHAVRLARWRARRDRDTARPRRFSPLRPGFPPGWRRRTKTALEEILAECNFLARDAWADTS